MKGASGFWIDPQGLGGHTVLHGARSSLAPPAPDPARPCGVREEEAASNAGLESFFWVGSLHRN